MASHLLEKVAQDGTNSLRERVYRHLEAALREGQLHHGTCLDQDRLCEELGVSRTPLRDALLRLEAEGFVTIQPRKGVYITPVSDAFVKSACQILGALEADCLDTVFPLLTSRHIRQLEESNKRQEQFLERRQAVEYHAENARFHDIFLSLSSNTLLYQTIGPLRRIRVTMCIKYSRFVSLSISHLGCYTRYNTSIEQMYSAMSKTRIML